MFEIYNGRSGFWQWDLNQKLILRVPCQVHFCNGTSDCSLVVDSYEHDGMYLADVPNVLMQTSGNLNVFAYIMDHDERYTKVSAVYRVHERSKPADYVYTETEVRNWENVSQEALNMVQSSCDDMDAATQAVRDALESGALKGEKGDPGRDGAEGKPGRDGVDGRDGLDAPQIDDTQITQNNPWSSSKIIDTLCPPFEQAGNPVVCHPVAGYPLGVSVSVEPVQHFDWASKTAESTQVTTTGKNLFGIGTITVSKYDLVPIGTTLAAGTYTISAVVSSDDTDYSACLISFYNGETATGVTATLARSTARTSRVITLESEATHMYLYASQGFNQSEGDTATFADFQIEAGSTATAYEPYTGGKASPSPEYPQEIVDSIPAGSYYVPSTAPAGGYWRIDLDEALGGVDGYRDALEVDSYTGRYRIIHHSGVATLSSGMVNTNGSTDTKFSAYWSSTDIGRCNNIETPVICENFVSVKWNTLDAVDEGELWWATSSFGICFDASEVASVSAANKWLSENPVIIRFALAEPLEIKGQAEHVFSTTGLTALKTVTMGQTEPDPDHPCEITMQKSVTIRRTGKNLIDVKQSSNYEKTETGLVGQVWATPIMDYNNFKTFIRPGATLTTSGTVRRIANPDIGALSEQNVRIGLYSPTAGSTMQLISWGYSDDIANIGSSITKSETVILPEWVSCEDLRMLIYGEIWREEGDSTRHRPTFEFSNLQIETGSAASKFEPYQGDTFIIDDLPVDFAGGEVDIVLGKCIAQRTVKILDGSEEWSRYSYMDAFRLRIEETMVLDKNASLSKVMCSHFSTRHFFRSSNTGYLDSAESGIAQEQGAIKAYAIRMPGITDIDEWRTYLASQKENGTPVTIYYEIAKEELPITPQPIPAISGTNTLMTDAQDMTVTGRADPVHKIQELEQAILSLGGNV